MKIEENGKLREMLEQKYRVRKQESSCFKLLQDVSAQNFTPLSQMDTAQYRLMILDHDFALDSNQVKSVNESSFDKTLTSNNRLKSEFVQNLKSMIAYRPCRRCSKEYLPIQNSSNSCKYHSGNKKYFSCKNCGKDVYYTCCNWCDECIEGCALTYHI